jgi:hypothetical protein
MEAKKRAPRVDPKLPSPRSSASFVAHPSGEEIILFGGEHFNGKRTLVYDDLYIYNIRKVSKGENKSFTFMFSHLIRKNGALLSLKIRLPLDVPTKHASSHETPGKSGCLAESSQGSQLLIMLSRLLSPGGNQFQHYGDLWVLHLDQLRWEKVEAKGGPSPRSGITLPSPPKRQAIEWSSTSASCWSLGASMTMLAKPLATSTTCTCSISMQEHGQRSTFPPYLLCPIVALVGTAVVNTPFASFTYVHLAVVACQDMAAVSLFSFDSLQLHSSSRILTA